MSLKEKIKENMTAAMKAKAPQRLQSLRNIWNAIRKKEIDDRKDLTDTDVEKVLLNLSKQVQESIDQAKGSGRAELALESEQELAVIKEFLPKMMSSEELSQLVAKVIEDLRSGGSLPAGNAAMGQVMKKTLELVGSRADGRLVQDLVRKGLQD